MPQLGHSSLLELLSSKSASSLAVHQVFKEETYFYPCDRDCDYYYGNHGEICVYSTKDPCRPHAWECRKRLGQDPASEQAGK